MTSYHFILVCAGIKADRISPLLPLLRKVTRYSVVRGIRELDYLQYPVNGYTQELAGEGVLVWLSGPDWDFIDAIAKVVKSS